MRHFPTFPCNVNTYPFPHPSMHSPSSFPPYSHCNPSIPRRLVGILGPFFTRFLPPLRGETDCALLVLRSPSFLPPFPSSSPHGAPIGASFRFCFITWVGVIGNDGSSHLPHLFVQKDAGASWVAFTFSPRLSCRLPPIVSSPPLPPLADMEGRTLFSRW